MKEIRIPESSFVLSCPHIGLAPKLRLWEIAFAGRSNVGKSSLINSLLNRKSLSLTSKTPGKTRLLNYFLIGKNLCYFVDLPGYGYAKVGQAMKEEWGETIEGYLEESQLLALVVLIIDIRHGPTVLDKQMIEGLAILRRPWIAVLTKSDKLGAQEKAKQMKAIYGELISSGARGVVPYSSLNNIGRNEVWQEILKAIEAKK